MPNHLKDESVRARRNKASTRSTLSADHSVRAPMLPKDVDWHPMVKRWWRDLWKSPMATEYITLDHSGLFRVAMLHNDFWTADTPKERAEAQVRLEKADGDFGTSPLARRRLEWQIEETDAKQAQGTKRRTADSPAAAQTPAQGSDPRLALVASTPEASTA